MKIAVIGSGSIGSTLVRRFREAGHTVFVANSRGPASLAALAAETGARAVTNADAVKDVDAIILSIPFGKVPELRHILAGVSPSIPVIDTSNYYPHRDGHISAVDNGQVESLWVQEQLGHAIAKAWNNVLAGSLATNGLPAGAPGRLALSVAATDPAYKKVGMELMELTGYDAIDGGTLEESWRQQPGTPGYCVDITAPELRKALAAADREKAPKNRDRVIQEVLSRGTVTNDDLLRLNRSLS